MDTETAFMLGKNCALCGANTYNSNFKIFSKPEFTKAWEKGKAEGERIKKQEVF